MDVATGARIARLFGVRCCTILAAVGLLLGACNTSNTTSVEQGASLQLLEPGAFVDAYSEAGDDAQLIDCRTPGEVAEGALPGAVNIDYRSEGFGAQIRELDRSQPVFVYCQGGGRSAAAAEQLIELGFSEVVDMRGGYGAYQALDLRADE